MSELASKSSMSNTSELAVHSQVPVDTVASWQLYEGELRLDASYHLHGPSHTVSAAVNWTTLAQICSEISYPHSRFKRVYVTDEGLGVPFLSAAKALSFRSEPKGLLRRSAASMCLVKPGTILVTRSGTVGRSVIVGERLSRFAVSDDLIRITNPSIPVGYLYAYLETQYGNQLVKRDQYGSAIKHLESHHLRSVPVPLVSETNRRHIDDLIQAAFSLRDQANVMLDEAIGVLHTELDLPVFPEDSSFQAFSIGASQLFGRFDASYHAPSAAQALRIMRAAGLRLSSLGEEVQNIIWLGGFKRNYVTSAYGVPFLQGSHITQMKPRDLKYIAKNFRNLERYLIHKNWVLITCGGTVGNVTIASEATDGWAASQHILRVVPRIGGAHPGYLAAFLMAPYGRHQLVSKTYGAVVDELTDNDMAQVRIPDVSEAIQERIGRPVVEAFRKKDEATQIEIRAIQYLEELLSEVVPTRETWR